MSAYPRHTTLPAEDRARLGNPSELLKAHQCSVTYIDGGLGTCQYERNGSQYHRLTYRYGEGRLLARVTHHESVQGAVRAVEALCHANAEKAFAQAIEHERTDFFARATFPTSGGRSVDTCKATLTADRAKRLGGRYAVCLMLPSGKLLAISRDYEKIEEANARFLADPKAGHVVACCSRLDRRWMVPQFNPIHGMHDFRKEVQRGTTR